MDLVSKLVIPTTDQIFAVHGSSVQAVEMFFSQGTYPAGTAVTHKIYVTVPRDQQILGFTVHQEPETSLLSDLRFYSRNQAFKAHLNTLLKKHLTSEGIQIEGRIDVGSFNSEHELDSLVSTYFPKLTSEILDPLAAEARTYLGVVVVLGDTVTKLGFEPDDDSYSALSNAFRIHVPNGLDSSHILGIVPVGKPDYDALKKLSEGNLSFAYEEAAAFVESLRQL